MKLRLTRKLAESINGVDLSRSKAGDIIDLPDRAAALLLAEGWAVLSEAPPAPRAQAAGRQMRQRPGAQ